MAAMPAQTDHDGLDVNTTILRTVIHSAAVGRLAQGEMPPYELSRPRHTAVLSDIEDIAKKRVEHEQAPNGRAVIARSRFMRVEQNAQRRRIEDSASAQSVALKSLVNARA